MPLSDKDVKAVLAMKAKHSARQIAKELGLPRSDVQKVLDTGSAAPSAAAPLPPADASRLPAAGWIAALLLTLQNLAVYWRHYFQGAGFPGDFMSTSQALPFYWITSLQQGIFPQWVPFQSMGFPLPMVTLSGIFYLPQWVWVVSGVSYSESHAVLFQGLHVLFGALGMYRLCRLQGFHPVLALAGAVAFQASGGFYFNAQHYPIIRTYALTPWLLIALSDRTSPPARTALLPAVVFLMFTGGYPGTVLATLFFGACLVAARTFLAPATSGDKWKGLLVTGGLVALGGLMAAVALAPAFALKSELTRSELFSDQKFHFFRAAEVFTLGMTALSDRLNPIVSLRSLFITLPLFAGLFFVNGEDLRTLRAYLIAAAAAAAMSFVEPFFRLLSMALPPLAYSRFPLADYRVVLSIPLILLGLCGARRLLSGGVGQSRALISGGLIAAWAAGGWLVLSPSKEDAVRHAAATGLFLAFLVLVAWMRPRRTLIAGTCFALLAAASGFLTNRPTEDTWYIPDFVTNVRKNFEAVTDSSGQKYDYEAMVPGAAALKKRLAEPPSARPARRKPLDKDEYLKDAFLFAWRGYLTGEYMLIDYSMGMQLWRQRRASSTPSFAAFMMRPSTAVSQPAGRPLPEDEDSARALLASPAEAGFKTVRYGTDRIEYEVSLPEAKRVIENEMYFPGWSATLSGPGADTRISAKDAWGALRAWELPAGTYRMTATFEMPYLRVSAAVSAAAMLAWVGLIAAAFLRRERKAA